MLQFNEVIRRDITKNDWLRNNIGTPTASISEATKRRIGIFDTFNMTKAQLLLNYLYLIANGKKKNRNDRREKRDFVFLALLKFYITLNSKT